MESSGEFYVGWSEGYLSYRLVYGVCVWGGKFRVAQVSGTKPAREHH